MAKLMPAEEEAFEVERREKMIDPGHPLRHPVIVGVFRLERELEETPGGHRGEMPRVSIQAAVGADSPKGGISVCNQPEAEVAALAGKLRRPEDCSHEVVIEIGGPESELGLLQREKPIMVPGSLPEDGKGNRVRL